MWRIVSTKTTNPPLRKKTHLHPSNHHTLGILLHRSFTRSHGCHDSNYVELVLLLYVDAEFKGNNKMVSVPGKISNSQLAPLPLWVCCHGNRCKWQKGKGHLAFSLKHSTNTVSYSIGEKKKNNLVYGRSEYREHSSTQNVPHSSVWENITWGILGCLIIHKKMQIYLVYTVLAFICNWLYKLC